MTSGIIDPPIDEAQSNGETGKNNISEQPDKSAAWVFHSLTETNPFRKEFEAERVVMSRLRAGVSIFDLVAEADAITAEADPWPAGSIDALESPTPPPDVS